MSNNYTPEREKVLVCRLMEDDEKAFAELYSVYKKRLIFFILRFVKSDVLAEDVFQDTFTSVWQTRHFLDTNSSFSSFLYTIARNRVLNIMRVISSEEKLQKLILAQSIDFTEEAVDLLEANELKEVIARALTSLTKRQREVFEMSRTEGKSHEEIARVLNISVYTVQEHISSSLKTIRYHLNQYHLVNMMIFFSLLSVK